MSEATIEAQPQEEVPKVDKYSVESLPFNIEEADEMTASITRRVLAGLRQIDEANVVLSEDNKASVKKIDESLAQYKGDDDELLSLIEERRETEEALKEIVKNVRNYYRVHVLGEPEVEEKSVDEDTVRAVRKSLLQILDGLRGFAQVNGETEVLAWADSLVVPNVGKGGATILGIKKARVWVSVDEKVPPFKSFGEAAKALSALDGVGEVSSTDLNIAWQESGEQPEFDFKGHKISVKAKETAAEKKAREEAEAKKTEQSEEDQDELLDLAFGDSDSDDSEEEEDEAAE